MDLKLAITAAVLAVSVFGDPVPPGSPKYVPVFVSSDALNQLAEKDRQKADQAIESRQESPQGSNDYDKEIKYIFNGPPAPVYEHQPDHHEQSYSPPLIPSPQVQNYQNNPQALPLQQQYQTIQTPQIQQPYQVNPQPIQAPAYQIIQQPSQQYQLSQPAQPQLYQVQQQPAMHPIVVTQPAPQPIYSNQQLLASQQPQQTVLNQQPMLLNQQQLVAQPIQTLHQPNQLLIGTQPGNQQVLSQPGHPILLNQQAPTLPNQQAILLQQQTNPNGQAILTGNINPINLGQPSQVNPGYIQNQNQNVYAMVPINGQNVAPSQNVGTNTYLVPVQQVPSQVYSVNSG